jgi:hypothetical protein
MKAGGLLRRETATILSCCWICASTWPCMHEHPTLGMWGAVVGLFKDLWSCLCVTLQAPVQAEERNTIVRSSCELQTSRHTIQNLQRSE